MQSRNFTDYCVLVCFALCFSIILRLFCFVYLCLISMQRHRSKNFDKIKLPQDSVDKFDEEKWLLQQQHEILKTKYKCLKQLFNVYNTNVIVHYKHNLKAAKRKECLNKSPEPKTSICNTNISSKISDYEISGTDVTKYKHESYEPETFNQNAKARTIAIQTDESIALPTNITNKGGYHALNPKGNYKYNPVRDEMKNCSTSKMSIFKNYIQKVLGQNREADKPVRIRNRRHITFNFSKKSLHKISCKNVEHNNFAVDNNPLIVSLVEVARKSCLADKTLRRCRVYGCGFICYGIIDYNTHMNAVHYPDRKYMCYFCHESFDKACDKFLHENKHLGVKFDMTGGSSKNDTCCDRHNKISISQDIHTNNNTKQSMDCRKVKYHDGKVELSNKRFKDINVSMTPSDITQTTIYKAKKTSQVKKPKCPHTISSIYQSDSEFSDCLSSKNVSQTTNLTETCPKQKLSCRFCQKSFDSKCKLLYHINLKHAEMFKSDVDMSAQKGEVNAKELANKLEHKDSNSDRKCTESVCVSHVTKKSSKVSSLLNRVKNGLHKYKWEPGTRIIRI